MIVKLPILDKLADPFPPFYLNTAKPQKTDHTSANIADHIHQTNHNTSSDNLSILMLRERAFD